MWFLAPQWQTSATNKAIITLTKHLSQKTTISGKNGVITSDTTTNKLAITSATNKNLAIWQKIIYNNHKKQQYYEEYFSSDTIKTRCLAKENISHTPDEAISVGLAKACVPLKN